MVSVQLPAVGWLVAGELYRTDFEYLADKVTEWPAGDDKWIGLDGWFGNATGASGIDQDIIEGGGLGKTGSIGFTEPSSTTVSVVRSVAYDPHPGDLPVYEVQTIVGVQDSVDKPARDSFYVSIWNSDGDFMAAICFANHPLSFGLWRLDGTLLDDVLFAEDTGQFFIRGQLHLLTMRVDLPNNRWSADLDGIPLFDDAPFHGGSYPVNCGLVGYQWQLTATNTAGHGDNWMMVADLIVRSTGRGVVPFRFSQFVCNGSGVELEWPGEIGFDYQVEYSADASTWHTNLPNSEFTELTGDQVLNYTDSSAPPGGRFYRVIRSEAP
jgi:hypothetical protein